MDTLPEKISLLCAFLLGTQALFTLPRVLMRWKVALNNYGGFSWGITKLMLIYAHKSRLKWLVRITAFSMLLAIPMILRTFIHTNEPLFHLSMFIALLALSAVKICEISIPPSILFLCASTSHSAKMLIYLNRSLPNYRTVALLDPRELLSPKESKFFIMNNLRTKNTYEWRSIVYHLMDVVPIILIDARTETRGVQEEISRLEKRSYLNRTGFFIEDGSPPPPTDKWEQVTREYLPLWIMKRLKTQNSQAERIARQKTIDLMLAVVPKQFRTPDRVENMIIKARYIQGAEVNRFLRECKGIDPLRIGNLLLEDIPSRVSRADEIRFFQTSRSLEEVEILLLSALEEVENWTGEIKKFNTANLLSKLGIVERLRTEWKSGEKYLQNAMSILSSLLDTSFDRKSAMIELSSVYFHLGDIALARYRETCCEAERHQAQAYYLESIRIDSLIGGDKSIAKSRLDNLMLKRA